MSTYENRAPGRTGNAALEIFATNELPENTPKLRSAQPDSHPGRIIREHYLRADEWPALNHREASV